MYSTHTSNCSASRLKQSANRKEEVEVQIGSFFSLPYPLLLRRQRRKGSGSNNSSHAIELPCATEVNEKKGNGEEEEDGS